MARKFRAATEQVYQIQLELSERGLESSVRHLCENERGSLSQI